MTTDNGGGSRPPRQRPPHDGGRKAPPGKRTPPGGQTPPGRRGAPVKRSRPAKRRRVGLIPAAKLFFGRLWNSLSHSPLVPVAGGVLLLCLIAGAGIWLFTNKNALDVHVIDRAGETDTVVASIAKNNDMTAKWVHDNAIAKLAADTGTNVRVVGLEVELAPSHKAAKELVTSDHMIEMVYKAFSESVYEVEAAEVMVNGTRVVTLRSRAEADSVLDEVMASYVPEGAKLVEKGWWEDTVEVSLRFTGETSIESAERAIEALTFKEEALDTYQVRSGESVWGICRQFGITQDRLIELNPGMPEIQTGNIIAGQIINIVTPKPLCSVRTVEEVTFTRQESLPPEERPVGGQAAGYRRVIQEGRPGTREVVAHVTRINGVETGDRVEITSQWTVSPVVEIVEVGAP